MVKTKCGIILAAKAAVICAAEAKEYTLADEMARKTPDWFRKGVMYQIQPRAFTPEGTIKAAEGKLAELANLGVTVVYMCPVTVADDNPAMTAPGQKWLDNDKPESVLSLRRGESAANGIVFVGNFSGKPVTVGVESVAADKAMVLLANGAVIFGASFRLAPWGFAFMEER